MIVTEYPISTQTENYITAAIENNKFAIIVAGAPFLSVILFVIVNELNTTNYVRYAAVGSAFCLLLTLIYSVLRLVVLHGYRARVLSDLALEKTGVIGIRQPPALLSKLPGFTCLIGYVALTFALVGTVLGL